MGKRWLESSSVFDRWHTSGWLSDTRREDCQADEEDLKVMLLSLQVKQPGISCRLRGLAFRN